MTAQTKHTPGPWWASKDQDARGWHGWRIDSDSRDRMAWAAWPSEDERDSIEAESTARLIAAAPELYFSLWRLIEWVELMGTRDDNYRLVDARAAIAKARGK